MKKIFYFIASAIVALGAVACQNEGLDNIAPEANGDTVSFVANIDNTKTGLNEELKTVWTAGDAIMVTWNGNTYEFKNSDADVNTFTCQAEGLKAIEVAEEIVATYSENNDGLIDSTAGLEGALLSFEGSFAELKSKGGFQVQNAFLKFTTTGAVKLKGDKLFVVDGEIVNGIVIEEAGNHYVAINPAENVTISYDIDGATIKSTTATFAARHIYNLGTLEAPAPVYKVYVIAQPGSNAAKWTKVNLYTWHDGGNNSWPGATITNNAAEINGYTYNYYEYPTEWNGKTVNCIVNNGSDQTPDIELGVLNKDYYVVYSTSMKEVYTEAPAAGSIAGATATESEWSLAGDFNNWGNLPMFTTDVENVYVAKNVTLTAYSNIKLKKGDWAASYGGGINYLQTNKWMQVYDNGSNIQVAAAGTYDVYFDNGSTKKLYLMTAGVDYKTAIKQTANGPEPDLSGTSWGLCGVHNNWGSNGKDIVLSYDGNTGLYVAKSVGLTGAFKVRANNDWGTNYGGGAITIDSASAKTLSKNGSDCTLSKYGTYDVYFQYKNSTAKIWVKTVGSAAPAI